uniref:probable glucuronoxylan glucuronosyltransferase IRX7 n=1 Tax=Erigeron canadensis TaxID=72917 RepID=UPI001CB8D78F|nr:probable glucuronoxylan glucuronosyltransferase IRX7 [Erigeron canadensis]
MYNRFTKNRNKLLQRNSYTSKHTNSILSFLLITSFIILIAFISNHNPNTPNPPFKPTLIIPHPHSHSHLIQSLNAVVLHQTPSQKSNNLLKLYIYDLPSKYNTDWLKNNNNKCRNHLFASEVAIHEFLLKSHVRTLDPYEADFFYVPVYVSCRFSSDNGFPVISHARALISSAIDVISSEFPFWRRSNGSDHVFVASHDYGACFHAMEDRAVANGIPEFMKNSIILQTFGVKYRHRCQDVEHVVIPPYVSPDKIRSTLLKYPVNGRRDIFAFFRGKMEIHPKNVSGRFYSRRVRTDIWKKYGNDKRFYLKRRRFDGYLNEMAKSVFCLCPLGWAPWSPRLVEAVALGCVPVVIADGIRMPLESAIPWPEISITVVEKDIGKLGGILEDVAKTNLSTIQKILWDLKVRRSLLYHDDVVKGDATWHILAALSEKLVRSHSRTSVLSE